MSKTFALTKVLIKTLYSTNTSKKKKKFNLGPLGVIVLLALVVGSISIPLLYAAKEVANIIVYFEAMNLIIYIILPIATMMIVTLSIFTIISVFFLSTDNAILLPLPLKSDQLLLARFFSSLFFTYIIELVLLLPILIGLGIGASLPFDFYIIAFIVVLGLPIIPTAIITIILTFITRFTNLSKNKDLITYLSFFFMLIIALAFNFGFNSLASNFLSGAEIDPALLLESVQVIASKFLLVLKIIFPFMLPASYALVGKELLIRLLNTGFYILINLTAIFLFAKIGSAIYLKSIKGSGENPSKKKELSAQHFNKQTKNRSALMSFVITEWRLMARTPIYFLNLIFIIPLFPVLLFVSFAFGFESGGSEMDGLLGLIGNTAGVKDAKFFLIALGVLIFLTSVSLISSTAISRMGSSASFSKYIPIKPSIQLRAKTFWGIYLSLFMVLALLVGVTILGVISIIDTLILFLSSIPIIYLLNYLGLYVDLKRPKLDWTTEASAVKSNFNSLIVMFLSWGLGGILITLAMFLNFTSIPNGGYYLALITSLAASLITYLLYRQFNKKTSTVFSAF